MGYNMRNNEIQAVIGLNQIKRLDKNNLNRIKNFNIFLKHIDKSKFFVDFDSNGSCNYAFNFLLRQKNIKSRNKLELTMKKNNIEFRRGQQVEGTN